MPALDASFTYICFYVMSSTANIRIIFQSERDLGNNFVKLLLLDNVFIFA